MKKFIAAIAAMIISAPVFAYGEPKIRDHYKDVTRSTPYTERVCRNVDVPVRQQSFSAGKAVVGGIIGGIIGHNIGNKSNRHITGAFGTLAGSVLGGSENKHQGYRTETRCENVTTYHRQTESVYSHSTITFVENGKTYRLQFQK